MLLVMVRQQKWLPTYEVLLQQFPPVHFQGPGLTWSNSKKIAQLNKNENTFVVS